MAANTEKCILACEKCGTAFEGQDWGIRRATLANGVQWLCEIWPANVFPVDLLEGLHPKRFPVSYQTGFSSIASYNVEWLS